MSLSMSSYCSSDDSETHAHARDVYELRLPKTEVASKQLGDGDDDLMSVSSSNDTEATYPYMAENQPAMKAVKFSNEKLVLHCCWRDCEYQTEFLNNFTDHVVSHANKPVLEMFKVEENEYKLLLTCRWGNCSDRMESCQDFLRHLYIHIYHNKLKSLGENCIRRFQEDGPSLICQGDPSLAYAAPVPVKDFQCQWDNCSSNFVNIQDYFTHVRYHCLENPKGKNVAGGIRCKWNGCIGLFQNVTKLLDHMKSHTQEKVNACPTCGSLFASRTRLIDHCYRRQQEQKEQAFSCRLCFKAFASPRLLRDHIRSHVNNYRCPECDMSCISPSALKSHMIYRHSDRSTAHSCPHCSYFAKVKRDLLRHIKIHETPHVYCLEEGCQFKARSDRALETHKLKRHSPKDQKNYCCHLCECRYARGNILTKHLISVHNLHWPSGHIRFRYQLLADGTHSLLTVRYESEVVKTAKTEMEEDPGEILS